MTVKEAIAAAEAILCGRAAAEGEADPRWQAVIAVAEFIPTDPDAVWSFILRWGVSADADLRMAIATCLLEHLLREHFDAFYDRVATAAGADSRFAEVVSGCWVFSAGEEPERSTRFAALLESLRKRTG